MPIAITPEHNDLADSVRSLVARVAPSEVLHEALETPISEPAAVLEGRCRAGPAGRASRGIRWRTRLRHPRAGDRHRRVRLRRGAGPVRPFGDRQRAHRRARPRAKLLNDLASGAVIAAYAIDSGLTATRHGDGLIIRGEVRAVPAAAQASVLVLPVAIDSGEEWVVLDADQLEIEPVKSVDPLRPLAHVRANAVEVGDDRVLSNLSRTLARALMSTLLSAECIGVARWATDTATAYAKIREQFGRPIGQFQAIKHKCAEMIADTERATAAVWDAARAIDESAKAVSEDSAFEFAAAVAATSGARRRVCTAPRTASRCTAVSDSPGSTTPTSTTAARSCWPRASVAPPTIRSRSSTSRRRPECASSTSISTRRPRSCATRSARKSLPSKRFRARSAPRRSPRAAGWCPICPSRGDARRVRSSRSSSPRSSPAVRSAAPRWASRPG